MATNLQIVLDALKATKRIPCPPPQLGLPVHMHRDNILHFLVEEHGGGWVSNIVFENVPEGQPDSIGTPDAHPFSTQQEAFLAGARTVCLLVTGSPDLPFFLAEGRLTCVAYG
jgi:hypothetical protein